MPQIHYREALAADVPALVDLPGEGEAGGDRRMVAYLTGRHHPQMALTPRAMWMAEADGLPVGYIAGHLTRRFGCDGELQWIYVSADHRRNGVASRLLRLLANWFVGHGARRVCANVGDEAARPFYSRHGAIDLRPHWMVWSDIGQTIDSNRLSPDA